MKAIIRTKGGKQLSGMQLQEIRSPALTPDQLKIQMVSSRINPVDIELMKGMPFVKYKNPQIGGIDGAGIIMEKGASVKEYKLGDQVFFYRRFDDIGTWAQEIVIKQSDVALIPEGVSVQDAGSIALPILTAYEGLQELSSQSGGRILVHGAGGGVGFQVVQLAKAMGLEVVANASTRDFELLKSVGVQELIDYQTQAFEEVLKDKPVDYVFDVIGKDTLLRSIAMKPKKVVSLSYADVNQIDKTGMKVPGLLKAIMRATMAKYRRAAKKHSVELIGQVSGANGQHLKEAVELIKQVDYTIKPYQTITLESIQSKGLRQARVGTVILFR